MSKIDMGGSAHPKDAELQLAGTPDESEINPAEYGMTLLDYFAGKANEADIRQYANSVTSRAKARYLCARAMIAEKRRLEAEGAI